jgi:hypothetical protein
MRGTFAVEDLLEGSGFDVLLGLVGGDLDEASVLLLDGGQDVGNIGCVHRIITHRAGVDRQDREGMP